MLPRDVREVFRGYSFGAPVPAAELAEAERLLGHALPPVLRELYGAFDGFLGPTDSRFLFPLLHRPSPNDESLVSYTLFLRDEDGFPSFLQRAVAFGGDGTGPCWLIFLDAPNRVVRWDAEWEGDHYERLDGSILDVWRRAKASYDAIEVDER